MSSLLAIKRHFLTGVFLHFIIGADTSKDRDYEKEALENPYFFGYQSVHYVVKSIGNNQSDGILIPEEMSCEIQIRTLLQHAYAELTHDLIYKPSSKIPLSVQRKVGRSMALIETTDELFKETEHIINQEICYMNNIINTLSDICEQNTLPIEFSCKLNSSIYNSLPEIPKADLLEALNDTMEKSKYILNATASLMASTADLIYKQPLVLLIIFLIDRYPEAIWKSWDLGEEYLNKIFTHLGKPLPY